MSSVESLLAIVRAYSEATGLAEGTVAGRFLGRGSRVAELSAGGDMGSRQISKIIETFSSSWPENAVWPEDVERPGAVVADADSPCSVTPGD